MRISFDIEFKKNPYKGKYIAIEGIDGSGKTTQVGLLEGKLKENGYSVTVTNEPRRYSVVGKIIHEVLQSNLSMPPQAFQYLYSADRVLNQHEIVIPALKKGEIVLSHRSFWSVIPYGVMDKGLSNYTQKETEILAVAQGLLSMYHQFIMPDITFYLNLSVETALKRLSLMKKVKEIYEKKEKLERISEGYKWEINKFPENFVVVNAQKKELEITEEIFKKIHSIISN